MFLSKAKSRLQVKLSTLCDYQLSLRWEDHPELPGGFSVITKRLIDKRGRQKIVKVLQHEKDSISSLLTLEMEGSHTLKIAGSLLKLEKTIQ